MSYHQSDKTVPEMLSYLSLVRGQNGMIFLTYMLFNYFVAHWVIYYSLSGYLEKYIYNFRNSYVQGGIYLPLH